jgi:hypothetical protein
MPSLGLMTMLINKNTNNMRMGKIRFKVIVKAVKTAISAKDFVFIDINSLFKILC